MDELCGMWILSQYDCFKKRIPFNLHEPQMHPLKMGILPSLQYCKEYIRCKFTYTDTQTHTPLHSVWQVCYSFSSSYPHIFAVLCLDITMLSPQVRKLKIIMYSNKSLTLRILSWVHTCCYTQGYLPHAWPRRNPSVYKCGYLPPRLKSVWGLKKVRFFPSSLWSETPLLTMQL